MTSKFIWIYLICRKIPLLLKYIKLVSSLLAKDIRVIYSVFTENNGQSHDKEFMPHDAFHCITAVNDYSSKQILQLSHKKEVTSSSMSIHYLCNLYFVQICPGGEFRYHIRKMKVVHLIFMQKNSYNDRT